MKQLSTIHITHVHKYMDLTTRSIGPKSKTHGQYKDLNQIGNWMTLFSLTRFPINEKYGNLERFKFLINFGPLQYRSLKPEDKYVTDNNPPELSIEFFENQKNIENINCFSDEGNEWRQSNITFNKNILKLNFRDKFTYRRGRVNCSLNDDGIWRWFGLQFSVNQN